MSKFKIYLFDADQTIWLNKDSDYISSHISSTSLIDRYTLLRGDGAIFSLKPEIPKLFEHLFDAGNTIGIVSDNAEKSVVEALMIFDLWKYIDKNAVNIRLWDGYCPKHLMINEILSKAKFNDIDRKQVLWLDDKDYSREAGTIGICFKKVMPGEVVTCQ